MSDKSPESADDRASSYLSFATADRHSPLVLRIIDDIGREIIEGQLPPGTDLNTVDLARRFSSSRTPAREALIVLEREGLVEMKARRRPRVARLTLDQVTQAYEIRSVLYGLVSKLIVERSSDAQIESLHEIVADLQVAAKRQDPHAYFWKNIKFRQTEADICGNVHVRSLLGTLQLRTMPVRYISISQPGRLARSVADHERLFCAYQNREKDIAIALSQALVTQGLQAILKSGWLGADAADSKLSQSG
jgi:DNA-binding GntR family transcriptional regulator